LKTQRNHRFEANGFRLAVALADGRQLRRSPFQQADRLKEIEALRPVAQSFD